MRRVCRLWRGPAENTYNEKRVGWRGAGRDTVLLPSLIGAVRFFSPFSSFSFFRATKKNLKEGSAQGCHLAENWERSAISRLRCSVRLAAPPLPPLSRSLSSAHLGREAHRWACAIASATSGLGTCIPPTSVLSASPLQSACTLARVDQPELHESARVPTMRKGVLAEEIAQRGGAC